MIKNALRRLLLILIFLAALAGGVTWLGSLDPFGEVPMVREKWAYWQQHKEEFDTVFIGTSRTHRGIVPAVFDELNAKAGVPTHSFNFGIDGMFPPEDAYVAEAILRDPPKKLKWVILELGVFLGDFEGRPPKSVRSVYWHDWPRTWLVMRNNLWPKKRPVKWQKWFEAKPGEASDADVAMTHLEVWLTKTLNIGRGANLWRARAFGRPEEDTLGPHKEGFQPTSGDGVMRGDVLKIWREKFAERQQTPGRITPMRPYTQESLDRVLSFVRRCGAQGIVLIAPTTGELRGYPDKASKVPVFDFCDLQKYAELFVEDVRTDTGHVNVRGADLYTRRVSEEFLKYNQSSTSR